MRTRYPREFKLEIARLITNGERRCADICQEYRLSSGMVSRWTQEYRERGEAAWEASNFTSTTMSIPMRLLKLERDNAKFKQLFRNLGSL